MTNLIYDFTVNTYDLSVEVKINTGSTVINGVTQPTHTLVTVNYADAMNSITGIAEKDILQAVTASISSLTSEANGYADSKLIKSLLNMGFVVEIDTVATPAGFTATPGSSAGEIDLTWTNDPDVEVYKIFLGTASDHSDSHQIESGALTPHTVTGLITGTQYYLRLQGTAVGKYDSAFADDDAIAT